VTVSIVTVSRSPITVSGGASMSSVKTRKPRPIFAIDANRQGMFVRLKSSGVSPFVAMIDALPLVFFDKGKTAYLRVETALDWFEKELKTSPANLTYKQAIDAYRDVLEKFKDGEVEPG
jgi:hypothetical protein